MLKLALFVLPLGLDTFAAATALGAAGLPPRARLRVGLVLAGAETALPLVGLLTGRGLGRVVGGAAAWTAAAALAALGLWLLRHDEAGERGRMARLVDGGALPAVALGLSVGLDELAMGLTIGLLGLRLWLAVALVGAQALLLSQLGLRLGARAGAALGERAERLAGVALLGLAALVAVERLG